MSCFLLTAACNSTLHTGKIASGGAGATASTVPLSEGGSGGGIALGGTTGPGVGGTADGVGGAGGGGGGAVSAVGGSAGEPIGGTAGSAGFAGGIVIGGGGVAMGGVGAIGGGGVIGGGGTAGFAGVGGAVPRGGAGGRRGGAGGAEPMGGMASGGSGGISTGGVAGQTFVGQYGGGTAPSVVASGSEPSDVRPAAPTWTPPFAQALGTPGWRQSSERLCNANQGIETVSDVWVDERGVFALVASACSENMGVPCGKQGATLRLNSGAGWRLYFQYTNGSFWTTRLWGGFPNGPLLTSWDYFYNLALIDDQGVAELMGTVSALSTAFVVGDQVFYIVDWFGLSRYSAGTWTSVAPSSSLAAIWADSETVVAAGGGQTVVIGHGTDAPALLTGVPVGAYTAVWALGPNDIWFGNTAAQLLHYDGQKWEIHPTGSRDVNGTGGIAQLWGSEGVLYFSTKVEFGRWNGTSVEMLLTPPADADLGSYPAQFGRFWGTSAKDLFVPLRDSRYQQYACGGTFVLWYDGSTFHSF